MAYALTPDLIDYDSLYQTLSNTTDVNDPLFHICWRRQSCGSCLTGDAACSWCPFSSTCVPNPSRVPIFSPIQYANICPLGSKERWEIRTLPFGCKVSTVNFLSVLVAVIATLVMVGLTFLLVWLGRRIAIRRREKRGKDVTVYEWLRSRNWRIWKLPWGRRSGDAAVANEVHEEVDNDADVENGERRPLLG